MTTVPLFRPARLGLFLALLLAIAGCNPAKQAYDKGRKHLDHGRYDDAVVEFEEALRLCREKGESSCLEFLTALEQATLRAAQHHLARARVAFQDAQLDEARRHIDLAQHHDPQNRTYDALRADIDAAARRARTLHQQALDLAAAGSYEPALAAVDEAIAMDRSFAAATDTRRSIAQQAHDHALALAQDALQRQQYDDADQHARTAQRYLPESTPAHELLQTIDNRRQADQLVRQATPLLADDPRQAVALLTQAAALDPDRPDVPNLLHDAQQNLADDLHQQAALALDQNRLHDALDLYRQARDLLPSYRSPETAIRNVLHAIAARHNTAADNYLASDLPGNALLHSLLALAWDPENPLATERVPVCQQAIHRQIQIALAFVGFDAPPRHQALAHRLDSALLAHLHQHAPPYVVLLDRTDLQARSQSAEQPLDLQALRDADLDADVLYLGHLVSASIRETRSTTHETTTFQSGTELRPNPDHTVALRQVHDARSTLDATQADVHAAQAALDRIHEQTESTSDPEVRKQLAAQGRQARKRLQNSQQIVSNARAGLEAASRHLANTPPEIAVPVHARFRYPVHHVTKTAILSVTARLVRPDDFSVISIEELTAEAPASDTQVLPDPAHNVPADPLDLPIDPLLLDQAVDALIPELANRIGPLLDQPAEQLLADCRTHRQAARSDDAREAAIHYLFAHPQKDKTTSDLFQYVRSTLTFEDAKQPLADLLRQYCNVYLP